MTEYVLEHFETEERYMKEFNFPEYQTHRNEHIYYTNNCIDYKNRVVGGDFQIMNEILEYLKLWLVNHNQVTEKNTHTVLIRKALNKFSEYYPPFNVTGVISNEKNINFLFL